MEFRCLIGGISPTLEFMILCVGEVLEHRARQTIDLLYERVESTAWELSRRIERASGSLDVDDLIAVGLYGCVQAAERFCPSYGLTFEGYVLQHAKFEMINEIRRVVHSRWVWERRERLSAAQEKAEQSRGRPVSGEEVAAYLNVPFPEFAEFQHRVAQSLPVILGGDTLQHDWLSLSGREKAAEDVLYTAELLEQLRPALEELSARDQELLRLRFGQDLTLEEIGRRFGISKQRVLQLQQRIFAVLREHMHDRLVPDDEYDGEALCGISGTYLVE